MISKMKRKFNVGTLVFVSVFFLTLIFFIWFSRSQYYPLLNSWIQGNIVLYIVSLFLIKIIGILWPPISGGIFTLASIPFLGWKSAFIIDMAGSTVGGTIAYYLGKKYGYSFLDKILDTNVVEKIKKIKVKPGREIEMVFIYRLLFGSIIIEAIYYGAGVLKIPYDKFIVGVTLSHLLMGIPIFFLVSSIFSGGSIIFTIVLSVIALLFILKTRGRHFE